MSSQRIANIRAWRDGVRGKPLGQAQVQWDDADALLDALDAALAALENGIERVTSYHGPGEAPVYFVHEDCPLCAWVAEARAVLVGGTD